MKFEISEMETDGKVMDSEDRLQLDSFVGFVRYWASKCPDKVAAVFLADGEVETERLTYREIDRRSRAFAAGLQAAGLSRKTVLLMMPTGIDHVIAFVGSLYANAIPVPVNPPASRMHSERIVRIIRDSRAEGVVLSRSDQSSKVHASIDELLSERDGCRFIYVDDHSGIDEQDWVQPRVDPDSVAYLQYTSGSTSEPRGVMVTQRNLLEHGLLLQELWRQTPDDVWVSWLPLFHDMGLISGIIQPLYLGATAVLMPPMAFLQQPVRWLRALSRYRGTVSCAPNFAYEACATSIEDAQLSGLDLSAWALAVNGSEPVRASTLLKFQERFIASGFRPAASSPGYGLAEATLVVSCSPKLTSPTVTVVDAALLEQHRFVVADAGQGQTRSFVSAGKVGNGIRVRIVGLESGRPCEEGEIGEIWVNGPTVALGYWERPEQTSHAFNAGLNGGGDGYLRTGDIGTLFADELYIIGRAKDLIIVRGRNHYPQDIEQTVLNAHEAFKGGRGAAFSIEGEDEEKLVVVQELNRLYRRSFDGPAIARAVRAAVAEVHGLQVHSILLVRPATINVTSSGKIQRHACKAGYLGGQLDSLFAWHADENRLATTVADSSGSATILPFEAQARYRVIAEWLAATVAQKTEQPVGDVSYDVPFSHFGLDSVQSVGLSQELSSWLGRPVEPRLVYNFPSIERLALHLSQQPAEVLPGTRISGREPVALVGMACRFPEAESVDAYWDLLSAGASAIRETPNGGGRDALHAGSHKERLRPNTGAGWGGYLKRIDEFDPAFFEISAREARSMDPQHRLLLELTWHALEDAGIPPDTLAGSRTGVFVGICSNDYRLAQLSGWTGTDTYSGTGNASSVAANRLSYFLDLRGPSMAIDTACSSSLVAIHQACLSLRAGECDLAIVAGVNLILAPFNSAVFTQAQMLAADGRCKTFDESADGYVRGEGVGVVILKRNSDAENDGNGITAIIKGSAVNQDGRSNGLTAPNGNAQRDVIREALADACVLPAQVGYIEAHGTGTSLGDPIEVGAIQEVFDDAAPTTEKLWVGSTKTNIGHLEAAAGIAGLIKIALMFRHRRIPRHLNLKKINPLIALDESRVEVPVQGGEWVASHRDPLIAGVSSFGFGGTNAHVVMQEPRPKATLPVADDLLRGHLLTLSARNQNALRELATLYADLIDADPLIRVSDISRASNVHRSHMSQRLALFVRSRADAQEALRRLGNHEDVDALYRSGKRRSGKTAFLFSGHSDRYGQAGRYLFAHHVEFRAVLEQCDDILHALTGHRPVELAMAAEREGTGNPGAIACPAAVSFSLAHALTETWRRAGVAPDCVMGFGPGKYLAACFAGVVSLPDALKMVVYWESKLASPEGLLRHVPTTGAWTGVSAEDPMHVLTSVGYARAKVDVISPATGMIVGSEIETPEYWLKPVDETGCGDGAIESLIELGCDKFIDFGLDPLFVEKSERMHPDCTWIRGLNDECEGDAVGLLDGFARWYTSGNRVDWKVVHADFGVRPPQEGWPKLPSYPFQRKVYWFGQADADDAPQQVEVVAPASRLEPGTSGSLPSILGDSGRTYLPEWVAYGITPPADSILASKSVLLVYPPEAAGLAGAVADVHERSECVRVELAAGPDTGVSPGGRRLDIEDPDAFGPFIQALPSFSTVYFFAADGNSIGSLDPGVLEAMQDRGIVALFRMVKALATTRNAQKALEIKVITNGSEAVLASDIPRPSLGAIKGFMRSLNEEYGAWACCHLDIGSGDYDLQGGRLHELGRAIAAERQVHVAWREGKRFAQVLRPLDMAANERNPYREGGVYMIVGGAGGIGYELARQLAATMRAKIVLVGRSAQGETSLEKTEALRRLGGEAIYVQADVTVENDVAHAVEAAKAAFGALNGVVHSALVLEDRAVANMDEGVLRSVLAPKLRGSVVLYRAVARENLDFLVFFSSAVSFMPSAGQTNYAAANTFQDAFAQAATRESTYPVKVINWGYWGGVGVGANRLHQGRMARQGIGSISEREGLSVLRSFLSADATQAMYVRGNGGVHAVIEAHGGVPAADGPVDVEASATEGHDHSNDLCPASHLMTLPHDEAFLAILHSVTDVFCDVLQTDLRRQYDDMGDFPNLQLSELGLDSLMALDARDRFVAWVDVNVALSALVGGASIRDVAERIHGELLVRKLAITEGSISPSSAEDDEVLVF